jgi:hypothetical protein
MFTELGFRMDEKQDIERIVEYFWASQEGMKSMFGFYSEYVVSAYLISHVCSAFSCVTKNDGTWETPMHPLFEPAETPSVSVPSLSVTPPPPPATAMSMTINVHAAVSDTLPHPSAQSQKRTSSPALPYLRVNGQEEVEGITQQTGALQRVPFPLESLMFASDLRQAMQNIKKLERETKKRRTGRGSGDEPAILEIQEKLEMMKMTYCSEIPNEFFFL